MHKIKLVQNRDSVSPIGTKVFVDDKEMFGVQSVDISVDVDTIPSAVIQTYIYPSIELDADIKVEVNNFRGDLDNPLIKQALEKRVLKVLEKGLPNEKTAEEITDLLMR